MRSLISVALLVAMPSFAGPFKLPAPAAQQASAGCAMQASMMRQTWCGQLQTPGLSPETLKVILQNARAQRDQIAGYCTDDAAKAELAQLDACLNGVSEATAVADTEAEARRAAAGPAVASLNADPNYVPTRDRARTLKSQVQRTCQDATQAKQRGDIDWPLKKRDCDAADANWDAAAAEMRALLQKHGIDLRDGEALGLW